VLSIIGQFSSSEIARMLKVDEAAVRQRLARARKQFQQLYQAENGEALYDIQKQPAPLYNPQQRPSEHVESMASSANPTSGRNHAERFTRNPAFTTLR
jgi:hypothetical protein